MPWGGKGGWEHAADLDNPLPRASKPWMEGGEHVERAAGAAADRDGRRAPYAQFHSFWMNGLIIQLLIGHPTVKTSSPGPWPCCPVNASWRVCFLEGEFSSAPLEIGETFGPGDTCPVADCWYSPLSSRAPVVVLQICLLPGDSLDGMDGILYGGGILLLSWPPLVSASPGAALSRTSAVRAACSVVFRREKRSSRARAVPAPTCSASLLSEPP